MLSLCRKLTLQANVPRETQPVQTAQGQMSNMRRFGRFTEHSEQKELRCISSRMNALLLVTEIRYKKEQEPNANEQSSQLMA